MEVETEGDPSASREGGSGLRAESTPQRFGHVADESTEAVDIKPIIPDLNFGPIPTPPTATVVSPLGLPHRLRLVNLQLRLP